MAVSLAALLLVLSYPPISWGWLALFALVPFLYVISQASGWRGAAWRGVQLSLLFTTGLFYFALLMDATTWLERLGAFTAIWAIMACQFVLFSTGAWAVLRHDRRTGWLSQLLTLFTLTVLWWAAEWVTQKAGSGLAAYLGLTMWRYPSVVQLARWIGLTGVSAGVFMANGLAWMLWRQLVVGWVGVNNRISRLLRTQPGAVRWAGVAMLLLLMGWVAWQGAQRSSGVWPTGVVGNPVPVGGTGPKGDNASHLTLVLVQSGFTMGEYQWANNDADQLWRLFTRLLTQSHQGAQAAWQKIGTMDDGQKSPVLVLWGETVLHEPVLSYPNYAAEITALNREANTWLLAGLPWPDGTLYYNSAVLLDPQGEIRGNYAKTRTIPIAESWAARGSGWQPLQVNDVRVGVGLCSELIDPLPARVLAKNGAEVLVFLSSLDYLGHSSAQGLQAAFAPFRAAETGRYVAQVGSVGSTFVATPEGVIEAVLPGHLPGNLVSEVPAMHGKTTYVTLGDWPGATTFLLSLLVQLVLVGQRRRSGR